MQQEERDLNPQRASLSHRIGQSIMLAGILAPLIAAAGLAIQDANAATVYCMRSGPDGGSFGSITYTTYIDVWVDDTCPKDDEERYVAYDFYANASSPVTIIDMGLTRVWECGDVWEGPDPNAAVGAHQVNVWSGWAWPPNTCGFQADVGTTFYQAGYASDHVYTNVNT